MLELLQTHHRLTGADLGARLGVDERTVRRYAGTLADLGIPVTSRRGRYGGYRLMPGYKLPPLMLTDDEAVAVVLGLVAGRPAGPVTAAAAAAGRASPQVRRGAPPAARRRPGALRARAGMHPAPP